jgi:hypothetical protein
MEGKLNGWVGIDLDGTLAEWHGDVTTIGQPIPLMVKRVQKLLKAGVEVRIFTARVYEGPERSEVSVADKSFVEGQRTLITAWCIVHLGKILPITCTKDFLMVQMWDDRAVQVEPNTGRILGKAWPVLAV